jgi:sugar (pentulose or hexulose) kinase
MCYAEGLGLPAGKSCRGMSTYLTFDIGTTSLKTALIREDGAMLALHTEEYTFNSPRPDWAEMPAETYWHAAVTGARAVLAGADASDVRAIGFSSQGETFVPIDRDGRALRDAIVWTDMRAQSIADEWKAGWLPEDEYRHISGYPGVPAGLTVFKVAWLQRHEPALFGGDCKSPPSKKKAWKFLYLPDYLIYRMTGEILTDRVMGQFSGFLDIRTGEWEPRLLDAAGISVDQLPALAESGTVAGKVNARAAEELGVPVGTLVCLGANDQVCGAVGAGNVTPGIASETTGTSLALVATTGELFDDTRMLVGIHAIPGTFFALPFTNTSAIVLKWLRDLCGCGPDYDEFLAEVGEIAPGCDGLTVLPHFAGTASPTFNADARGAFVGLSLGHTRTHIARAVMESCACMLNECLGLVRDHGLQFDCVRSLGGAARSDVWLQMKADMIGLPVERPVCSDAGSLGAAMLAAAGVGQFASIEEASNAWYRPARRFEPDATRFRVYQEVYARYLDLYERLYGS